MSNLNLNGLINRIELNSLSSIQKAIQYFPLIPEVEKSQTILRIKNALKRLGSKVNIGASNPICKYLTPTDTSSFGMFNIVPNREDMVYVDSLESYISSVMGREETYTNELVKIITSYFNKDVIDIYDSRLYKKTAEDVDLHLRFRRTWYLINNIIFNYCNKKIMSLMKDAGEDTYQLEIFNAYLLDLNEAIFNEEILNIRETITHIHDMSQKMGYLPLETLGIYKMIEITESVQYIRLENIGQIMEDIRSNISDKFLLEQSSIVVINRFANNNAFGILPQYLHLKDSYIEDILEERKVKSEVEFNTSFNDILSTKRYRYHYNEIMHDASFKWIHSSLDYFSERKIDRFLKALKTKLLKTTIPDTQIYALKSAGIIQYFVYMPIHDLTLGISKKTCYVLASNIDKIYMFPIFNGGENDGIRRMELMIPITCRVIEFKNDKAFDLIPTDMMVIEATNKIEFDKDTNIRFKFKKPERNTYMNRYSDIHSLLIQNSRNKNYEAMKTDLCRLYVLVYIIERDVTHTMKAVSPAVKADGSKARMFAKNDLKRYLSEVTAHEKGFDLAKHFSESNIKSEIEKEYDIKINTLGVKKLLKTLI